ncbi:MAG: hypothetical protein ACQEWG_11220 [Bacteroidota bacterium]
MLNLNTYTLLRIRPEDWKTGFTGRSKRPSIVVARFSTEIVVERNMEYFRKVVSN